MRPACRCGSREFGGDSRACEQAASGGGITQQEHCRQHKRGWGADVVPASCAPHLPATCRTHLGVARRCCAALDIGDRRVGHRACQTQQDAANVEGRVLDICSRGGEVRRAEGGGEEVRRVNERRAPRAKGAWPPQQARRAAAFSRSGHWPTLAQLQPFLSAANKGRGTSARHRRWPCPGPRSGCLVCHTAAPE